MHVKIMKLMWLSIPAAAAAAAAEGMLLSPQLHLTISLL